MPATRSPEFTTALDAARARRIALLALTARLAEAKVQAAWDAFAAGR